MDSEKARDLTLWVNAIRADGAKCTVYCFAPGYIPTVVFTGVDVEGLVHELGMACLAWCLEAELTNRLKLFPISYYTLRNLQ